MERDDVSEQGRALWRRLWALGAEVQAAWPTLTCEDRALLLAELRQLVRVAQSHEG